MTVCAYLCVCFICSVPDRGYFLTNDEQSLTRLYSGGVGLTLRGENTEDFVNSCRTHAHIEVILG